MQILQFQDLSISRQTGLSPKLTHQEEAIILRAVFGPPISIRSFYQDCMSSFLEANGVYLSYNLFFKKYIHVL